MPGWAARFGRAFAAVALAAATGSAAVAAGPAGSAVAAATCTAPSVRIMVDFRPHTGTHPTPTWPKKFQGNGSAGNLVTACVPFTSGMTGFSLLSTGGFTTAGTQHDGPAFICRINNLPAPDGNPGSRPSEPCSLTPPAGAYWSYWHANPGQNTWTYSSLGAMSYHSVPGSVEVWVYGATDVNGTYGQPSFTPQSVLPAASPVGSGTTPAAPGAGGDGGVIVGPQPTGTEAGATGRTSSAGTSPTGATSSASGTTSNTAPSSSGGHPSSGAASSGASPSAGGSSPDPNESPSSVDIDSIAEPAGVTSSGTPWATIATIAVLAVAALVGGGVAWRRKRASS